MRIATVVGARPQFIKAAPVSRVLRARGSVAELIIHTGQHYDFEMSEVFFQELDIPPPAYHLGVGSGSHGVQTGEMLRGLDQVLLEEAPDAVIVYGDTNSTLAGALSAAKLGIPVIHVEAGLRSFDRTMPEEINRVLTDHLASLLLCPSSVAVGNLATEGITDGVHIVGDVMYDLFLARANELPAHPDTSTPARYALVTLHRAGNTEDRERLAAIFDALGAIAANGLEVVLPIHPRTDEALRRHGVDVPGGVHVRPPAPYSEMLSLQRDAEVILTDSGGVQKEAYWLSVPCVTLRDETEWLETLQTGWNVLAGANPDRIVAAALNAVRPDTHPDIYGDGNAAGHIAELLEETVPRLSQKQS